MVLRVQIAAYLEAGVTTKAFVKDGVRGDPFINDDQPDIWVVTLQGTWLLCAFT